MAIAWGTTKETFKVISRRDDALAADISNEEWDLYLKNLDESKLRFVPGKTPTRFVMRVSLSFAAKKFVQSEQLGIDTSGKPAFKFGYILEEVRCSLTDIEPPADQPEDQKLHFKRAADGNASEDLIAFLDDLGIAMELFTARQNKLASLAVPQKK